MRSFCVLTIFILVTLQNSPIKAQEEKPANSNSDSKVYPVNEPKFKFLKEKVCATTPGGVGGESTATWQDDMDQDEVYELALLNMAYGLNNDAVAHLPASVAWEKRLVTYLADITRSTCDNSALSAQFINGVKNLFLYYLYKKNKFGTKDPSIEAAGNDTSSEDEWNEILNALHACAAKVTPIPITDTCGTFESYMDSSGSLQPTDIVMEQLDVEMNESESEGFDVIIDSLWWMFSVTYARCYRIFYPSEDIILKFFAYFRDDVLQGLSARWRGGGNNLDWFSIILGPVDVPDEWENIRKCASAAYGYEGMFERSLVRPLQVTVDNQVVKNYKT